MLPSQPVYPCTVLPDDPEAKVQALIAVINQQSSAIQELQDILSGNVGGDNLLAGCIGNDLIAVDIQNKWGFVWAKNGGGWAEWLRKIQAKEPITMTGTNSVTMGHTTSAAGSHTYGSAVSVPELYIDGWGHVSVGSMYNIHSAGAGAGVIGGANQCLTMTLDAYGHITVINSTDAVALSHSALSGLAVSNHRGLSGDGWIDITDAGSVGDPATFEHAATTGVETEYSINSGSSYTMKIDAKGHVVDVTLES